MIMIRENRSTQRKTCPSLTSPTKNSSPEKNTSTLDRKNLRSHMKSTDERWYQNTSHRNIVGMCEMYRNKVRVRDGEKTFCLIRLPSIYLLATCFSAPPPGNLSHVFPLYFSSFPCPCYWRWWTGGRHCHWWSRWPPRTQHYPCSFFPWPDCSAPSDPMADIVWRQWCTFHSAIKAANLLTCRRVNGWQRQKFLPRSGFHELQKHNTK